MARAQTAGWSGIDASEFKGVAMALKAAQPLLRTELMLKLRAAGDLVARDAAAIVAPYSESIPPTIKVRQRGVSVVVQAGGADKTIGGAGPLAGLYELGNRGGKSGALTRQQFFRHPVFGNKDNWVEQEMHPFLAVSGEKNQAKVEAMVYEALDAVADEIVHGFGGASTA